MSEVKWIKITTDMFDNRKIKHIRKLPEGNNIILIWVMLLSLAGRCNAAGKIFLTENIPYTNKMLADELGFEESVICIALNTLEQFGMISRADDMSISVNNWEEYQNVDAMNKIREQTRKRVAKCREKKKLLESEKEVLKIENDDLKKDSDVLKREKSTSKSSKITFKQSKTNLENVNIVLLSEEYDYISGSPELKKCLLEWMTYKDEKKPTKNNHYDTERGIKKLLNQFIQNDKKYGTDIVAAVVDDAMSNNYQGIIWDKADKMKGGTKNNGAGRKSEKGYIQRIVESGEHVEFDGF